MFLGRAGIVFIFTIKLYLLYDLFLYIYDPEFILWDIVRCLIYENACQHVLSHNSDTLKVSQLNKQNAMKGQDMIMMPRQKNSLKGNNNDY